MIKVQYNIKHLCQRFNLARSTLLYYDSIGLLKATNRSNANYRKYSDEDLRQLDQICAYREVGLPLEEIKKLLGAPDSTIKEVLEKKLYELNIEVKKIRHQQNKIINTLKNEQLLKYLSFVNRDSLVQQLNFAGFDESMIGKLHSELEGSFPEAHQLFLESLGLGEEEILQIRKHSKASIIAGSIEA